MPSRRACPSRLPALPALPEAAEGPKRGLVILLMLPMSAGLTGKWTAPGRVKPPKTLRKMNYIQGETCPRDPGQKESIESKETRS
jgi:hypothetical protein